MSKGLLTALLFTVAGLTLSAKEVPAEMAKQTAIYFYYQRINQFKITAFPEISITKTFLQESDGKPVYYLFNMEPTGYIAVSADDAVIPVLAYSFSGTFSRENAPPAFVAWMKQYEDQIQDARVKNLVQTPAVKAVWDQFTGPYVQNSLGSVRNAVAPLIVSNWDQGFPYNEQCPADAAGPSGHALVGCVPVCLGQLMYYYRWPKTGIGSYSDQDPTYGTLSANFGATTYAWDNMINTSSASNPGIAKLLFHLGVSCDLVYGPT